MASLNHLGHPTDLKVTLQETDLVFPLEETKRQSMFLSNIDQVLNFYVQTVHFFAATSEFSPEKVCEKIKTALRKVLVPYNFLAGRLKLNAESGRLEFDCNGAGVAFTAASSELSLSELGDLVYPNPAFAQLIVESLDSKLEADHGKPLCFVQVTAFKCGGFAMGVSTNHATFDGLSFKTFLQNLAAQAADKPLAVNPCNDRRLLAARSPPRVTFPHPELLEFKLPITQEAQDAAATVFNSSPDDLDFKIFRLSSGDVSALKSAGKNPNADEKAKPVTSFNAVTSHLWRCKAMSNTDSDTGRMSTVLYAVDIRPRLRPPLPEGYAGNAVLTAYATAARVELEEGPFWKLVEMVAEGAARMTDEYAKSAIDWGEVYKGFPHGEFLVSSWWRLGFAEVEYPWGTPKYSCPVVYRRKDIILLFPDIDEGENGKDRGGVNVLVALPHIEMEAFETFFHKFLAAAGMD